MRTMVTFSLQKIENNLHSLQKRLSLDHAVASNSVEKNSLHSKDRRVSHPADKSDDVPTGVKTQTNTNVFTKFANLLAPAEKGQNDEHERKVYIYDEDSFSARTPHDLNTQYPNLEEFVYSTTVLGRGNFGKVKLVKHIKTGEIFAMKILPKSQVKHIASETAILAELQHPFVIQMHSVFEKEDNICILLEFAGGGDLAKYLHQYKRFNETVAKFYVASTLLALEHVHKNKYIYRDLKPENLLIDHRGCLKLADFGLATKVMCKTFSMDGTPDYVAPEIIKETGHNHMIDYWSLGVVIYELLTGRLPFESRTPQETFRKVLQMPVTYPGCLGKLSKDLIKQLLNPDCDKRLGSKNGAADIKNHPWFKGFDWDALSHGRMTSPLVLKVRDLDQEEFHAGSPNFEMDETEFQNRGDTAQDPTTVVHEL